MYMYHFLRKKGGSFLDPSLGKGWDPDPMQQCISKAMPCHFDTHWYKSVWKDMSLHGHGQLIKACTLCITPINFEHDMKHRYYALW